MSRILLVEGNRDHLELMAYLLRADGHVLLSAGSGESGLAMMKCCQEIDLIICDINLGSVSGLDVVRSLRKSGRFDGIPIVAVTAGSMGQAPKAFAAGFNHYILKPIEPETFAAQIKRCLSGEFHSDRPRTTSDTASRAPAGELDLSTQATILAVDDKSANLELISALLVPLGHRVITARGVADALAAARHSSPDLILTDVHMGDGTGFDLIRAILRDAILKTIPWLVTSATYLSLDARAAEFHLDDSNFILQPWEPQAFVGKIRGRLRRVKASHPAGSAAAGG